MERIPTRPPQIPAYNDTAPRPLFSVMIPIYNGSAFLAECIDSVLQQDFGQDQMQIEVVDDCSTDADVEAIVRQAGRGRVSYYRQPQNVGSLRNFETCINRSRGELVHLLHCDDKVKTGFYKTMASLFEMFPQAGAAFCNHEIIKEDGGLYMRMESEAEKPCILENFLEIIAVRVPVQYVSSVIKRSVYEELGSYFGFTYGEDWELWGRVANKYPVAYSPEYLAQYRRHSANITANSIMTAYNLDAVSFVLDEISGFLPKEKQKKINSTGRNYYLRYNLVEYEKLFRLRVMKKIPYHLLSKSFRFGRGSKGFYLNAYTFIKLHYLKARFALRSGSR